MEQVRTNLLPKISAAILLLVTLALGLVDIYFCREIFFAFYARFSTEPAPAILWGDILVVLLAIVYLAFVIGTTEYHFKNMGKRESWDLFYKSLIVELAIPFLAYFMGA